MKYCCVPACNSSTNKNKDLSFHEFPNDIGLRCEWLKAISRPDFVPNGNSNTSNVCSKHFKDDDYRPIKAVKRLKPTAIPSIFSENQPEPCPSNSQKRRHNYQETGDDFILPHSLKASEVPVSKIVKTEHTQTDVTCEELSLKIKELQERIDSRGKVVSSLRNEIKETSKHLQNFKKSACFSSLKVMQTLEEDGMADSRILFLLAQVKNFRKEAPQWPEVIIRECRKLHDVSPKAYKLICNRNLLDLPSSMTLHKYNGAGTLNDSQSSDHFTDDVSQEVGKNGPSDEQFENVSNVMSKDHLS